MSAVASAVALPQQLTAALARQQDDQQSHLSLCWTPSCRTPSGRQKKTIEQIKSRQSNDKLRHKNNAISDELTYEDSEKRLIILLSIIGFCFLIWATSFLAIVVRLSKKYKVKS